MLYEVLSGASGTTEIRAEYKYNEDYYPELLATVTILDDQTPTPEVTVTTPNPTTATPTTATPTPTVVTPSITYVSSPSCTPSNGGPFFFPNKTEYTASPGDIVEVDVERRFYNCPCCFEYYYSIIFDETKLRYLGSVEVEDIGRDKAWDYTINRYLRLYEVLPGASGVTEIWVDYVEFYETDRLLARITLLGDQTPTPEVTVTTPTTAVPTTIPPTTIIPQTTTATPTPPVSVPPTTAVATTAVPTATTPSPVPTMTPLVTTATATPSPTPVPLPEVAVILLGNGEGSLGLDRNQDARLDAADLISTAR